MAGELELKKFVNDTVRPFFNRQLPDIMGRISTISIVMNDLKARVEKLEAQINPSMSVDEAIASVQPKAKKAKKATKAKK